MMAIMGYITLPGLVSTSAGLRFKKCVAHRLTATPTATPRTYRAAYRVAFRVAYGVAYSISFRFTYRADYCVA